MLDKLETAVAELNKATSNTMLAQNLESKRQQQQKTLVLPLNPLRMMELENAKSTSTLQKEFVSSLDKLNICIFLYFQKFLLFQIKELESSKTKNFSQLFTDDTQRCYNWTGRSKLSIQTSEVFLLVKSTILVYKYNEFYFNCFSYFSISEFWFNNDEEAMKNAVKAQWFKLGQKLSKRKLRKNNSTEIQEENPVAQEDEADDQDHGESSMGYDN